MKLKRVKDWNFFTKIIGLVSFSVVPVMLLIGLYILPTMKTNLIGQREQAQQNLVKVSLDLIKTYDSKAESG